MQEIIRLISLNELQSDELFQDLKMEIWKSNDIVKKYPLLCEKVQLYFIVFLFSSSLVKSGFG